MLNYLWLIKGDRPTAVYYGLVLVGLLVARVAHLRWAAISKPARHAPAPVIPLGSFSPEAT